MRKLKSDRVGELINLLGGDALAEEEVKRINDLTEEELMGELYILKKFGKPRERKEEADDELTLYCSVM